MTTVKTENMQRGSQKLRHATSGDRLIVSPQTDADIALMAAHIAEARAAERHAKIAAAAYFRAEQRGFEPGHELDDWLAAEMDVIQTPCLVSATQPTEWRAGHESR